MALTGDTAESKVMAALKADTSVAALVSTRIYPDLLPPGCTMPAVTITTMPGDRIFSAAGATELERARIQVDIYDEEKHVVWQVRKAIQNAMNAATTFSATGGTPRVGFMPETELYREILEFDVWNDEELS